MGGTWDGMTFDEYLARLRDIGFNVVNSSAANGTPNQAWRECVHGHLRYIWLPDTQDPEVLAGEHLPTVGRELNDGSVLGHRYVSDGFARPQVPDSHLTIRRRALPGVEETRINVARISGVCS